MKRSDLENKFIEEDRQDRLDFIKSALMDPQGRSFFWWLLQIGKAGAGNNAFATNALVMSFRCGEMQVGNFILEAILEAAPRAYPEMMLEQAELDRERGKALSGTDESDFQGGKYDE